MITETQEYKTILNIIETRIDVFSMFNNINELFSYDALESILKFDRISQFQADYSTKFALHCTELLLQDQLRLTKNEHDIHIKDIMSRRLLERLIYKFNSFLKLN